MKTSVMLLFTATLFLAIAWDKERKKVDYLTAQIELRDSVNKINIDNHVQDSINYANRFKPKTK